MGRESNWFQTAEFGGFEGEEFYIMYWLFKGRVFTATGWFQERATLPSNKLTKSKNMVDIVSLKIKLAPEEPYKLLIK